MKARRWHATGTIFNAQIPETTSGILDGRGYAAFEIPTGVMGDRIGARRVLTRVVVWWSAFTSLTGVVSSYPLLMGVRFCFGMGEAGAYPNVATVIGRWIPPAKRARTWGIVWMTSQLGAAIAPLLVVPLQMRYGWRASFYLFGVFGLLWSGVWYAWFRDTPREMRGMRQGRCGGSRRWVRATSTCSAS